MPTPTRVQSTTDTYIQNQDSVFSDGIDGSTALKATPTVSLAKKIIWDGAAFQLAKQAVAGSIAALTGIDSTLTIAQYLATLPTLTDTNWRSLLLSVKGELITANVDIAGSPVSITAADSGTSTATGQNSQSIITGTPTSGSVASIAVTGESSFAARVSGTWVGTLQFERTLDGTNWAPIGAFSAGTSITNSQIMANGSFHGNASSCSGIRLRCLTLTSGSPSIQLLAGAGTGTITVGNPLRLFDAVSGAIATIKPASTPATAADTAIVVTQRDAVIPGVLRGTLTDRSGTSSATQNQWTQAFPPNTSRVRWEFQNPPDSGVLMELGWGAVDATAGTSATRLAVLAPGDIYGESAPGQWINTDRLSVRVPASTSKSFIAGEV